MAMESAATAAGRHDGRVVPVALAVLSPAAQWAGVSRGGRAARCVVKNVVTL